MYRRCAVRFLWASVGSLKPRVSVDSEAVQAGVFLMPPVGEYPHLNDLEGFLILLLKEKEQSDHGGCN